MKWILLSFFSLKYKEFKRIGLKKNQNENEKKNKKIYLNYFYQMKTRMRTFFIFNLRLSFN